MTTGMDAPDEQQLDTIGLHVDLRLVDVWSMVFERGEDMGLDVDMDFIGWCLRLAYVTGYWDALSEPERGALATELGYPVPPRRQPPAST